MNKNYILFSLLLSCTLFSQNTNSFKSTLKIDKNLADQWVAENTAAYHFNDFQKSKEELINYNPVALDYENSPNIKSPLISFESTTGEIKI